MTKGIVFDIKRFAVHDGPGIRTSVFLKGCSLQCSWCQNPEGIRVSVLLWYFEKKCINCGRCLMVCPRNALSADYTPGGENFTVHINHDRCDLCGECVEQCPTRALEFNGKKMSSSEVLEEIRKDMLYYEVSGGGVTVTGGDPLVQSDFAAEILAGCKEESIHTALETCLYGKTGDLEKLLSTTDLFMVDLKLDDPVAHEKYTGADNVLIRDNFRLLAEKARELTVRIPLIPGATADDRNIRAITRYVLSVRKDIPIQLINYNPLAGDKYRLLKKEYPFRGYSQPFPAEKMEHYKNIVRDEGGRIENP